MDKQFMVRQGDILIVATKPVEAGKAIAREAGRIVLARGETTGHAHAIRTAGVDFVEVDGRQLLIAPIPFVIEHEEHGAIEIPPGTFQVIRQREYAPEAIRTVSD